VGATATTAVRARWTFTCAGYARSLAILFPWKPREEAAISCARRIRTCRIRTNRNSRPLIIISTGCPAGIGPEISVKAAAEWRGVPRVLVGDEETLLLAADLVGAPRSKLRRLAANAVPRGGGVYI